MPAKRKKTGKRTSSKAAKRTRAAVVAKRRRVVRRKMPPQRDLTASIELMETPEYSTPSQTFQDTVSLLRAYDGTLTVQVDRHGDLGESDFVCYLSPGFTTAEGLLSALRGAEEDSAFGSFDDDEIDEMLRKAEELVSDLSRQARTLLAKRQWSQWPAEPSRPLP